MKQTLASEFKTCFIYSKTKCGLLLIKNFIIYQSNFSVKPEQCFDFWKGDLIKGKPSEPYVCQTSISLGMRLITHCFQP